MWWPALDRTHTSLAVVTTTAATEATVAHTLMRRDQRRNFGPGRQAMNDGFRTRSMIPADVNRRVPRPWW
ncbi:hypothetical protein GCM10010399_63030 [Dactylosporangium fulvum]